MSGLTIRDLTVTMGTGQRARQIITGIDLDVPAGRITGPPGASRAGPTLSRPPPRRRRARGGRAPRRRG